jgi:DNA-binding protein WhiA
VTHEATCCGYAELLGLLRSAGKIRLEGAHGVRPKGSLEVCVSSALTARKTFSLFKSLLGTQNGVFLVSKKHFGSSRSFVVRASLSEPPYSSPALERLGLVRTGETVPGGPIPQSIHKRSCCRRSFLRGAFLGSGSISNPGRGHHLEIRFSSEETAKATISLLEAEAIKAKVFVRKGENVIYIKEAGEILNFLGIIGAHTAVLKYEDALIVRGIRQDINRMVNCETANVSKVVEAGLRQASIIKSLIEKHGIKYLPVSLRETALFRMAHPEMSLRELGQSLKPPMSKSGANHRLRRIEEIAMEAGLAGSQEVKKKTGGA